MLTAQEKFRVLHRDDFTCMYCGAKPGAEFLQVDHLIPQSIGGSDNDENLVAACVKCNQGKSDSIIMPKTLVQGIDSEGWFIHKSFGAWSIRFIESKAVVESSWGYWFDLDRCFEDDWVAHVGNKPWGEPHALCDFIKCLEYARRLVLPYEHD
jgi:hypothetical protein